MHLERLQLERVARTVLSAPSGSEGRLASLHGLCLRRLLWYGTAFPEHDRSRLNGLVDHYNEGDVAA